MAIAERTIHISRIHIPAKRYPRKSVPTTPKTLGDHIRLKRYEKGLLLRQVAEMTGVTVTTLKSFESDATIPNDLQWQSLEKFLMLDPGLKPTKSNS